MHQSVQALLLLSAAASLSSCGGSDDANAADGLSGQPGPGFPAADPLQGSTAASVGINYPSGIPYAGGPARIAITMQGTGDLSTPSCQSQNAPLRGDYNSATTAAANGVAIVDLSVPLAAWQGAGCAAPAGSGDPVSVHFDVLSSVIVTAEVPANTATCSSYCFGQPRAPSCEEHCLTFTVIQVNQPLTPSDILAYATNGQLAKAVYLNELH